jgi:hypothetical protein
MEDIDIEDINKKLVEQSSRFGRKLKTLLMLKRNTLMKCMLTSWLCLVNS